MRTLKSLLFIPICFFLVNCSSVPQTNCQTNDWYETGRREGIQGLPEGASPALNSCSLVPQTQAYNLYVNGRNAGLAEFCTPENGFFMGKIGQNYEVGVCPALLEKAFLNSYEKGRKISKMDSPSQKTTYLR